MHQYISTHIFAREFIFSVTQVGLINLRAHTPHTEFATLFLIKIASLNETHHFAWFGVSFIDEPSLSVSGLSHIIMI